VAPEVPVATLVPEVPVASAERVSAGERRARPGVWTAAILLGLILGVVGTLARSRRLSSAATAAGGDGATVASSGARAAAPSRDRAAVRRFSVPPPPPRWSSAALEPVAPRLSVVPGEPGYNPVKVATVLHRRSPDIFEAEPVDPQWAPRMQERIERWVRRVIQSDPSVELRDLSCRTASCKMVLVAPTMESIRRANKALYASNEANLMGVVGVDHGPDGYSRPFYLFFSAWRSIEAHEKQFGP
jgi:hypothetical protein